MKKDGPFPKTNSKNALKIGSNPKKEHSLPTNHFSKAFAVSFTECSLREGLGVEH